MPVSRSEPFLLIPTTAPIVALDGPQFLTLGFDHISLFVDFTLGNLTAADVAVELSNDGVNFFPLFSATGARIRTTFDFAGPGSRAFIHGAETGSVQMTPASFSGTHFRMCLSVDGGDNTGSSIKVQGMPYTVGSLAII